MCGIRCKFNGQVILRLCTKTLVCGQFPKPLWPEPALDNTRTTAQSAGGQTKQGDASEWLRLLKDRACGVVLFGRGAEELHQLICSSGYTGKLQVTDDLAKALPLACRVGEEQNAICLLLSPACASFDQYSDFEARGEHFRSLVNAARMRQKLE